jgi:hypothetical protein
MAPDELRRIGQLLFGPDWQAPLARALNINTRTVQRWATGEAAPKGDLRADLAPVADARVQELQKLADELKRDA